MGQVNYYPYAGWSFDYYPFTGQQGYKSPLVAVQFMELPHREYYTLATQESTTPRNLMNQSRCYRSASVHHV